MEIERVCISLHIWRIRIFSNYRSVCNKNQYTTENFCLLQTRPRLCSSKRLFDNLGKVFYAFPPLAFLSKTLQKIYRHKATGMLIAPDWPSQPFYPILIEMTLQIISILPRKTNLCLASQPSLLPPFHRKLPLLACLVDWVMID